MRSLFSNNRHIGDSQQDRCMTDRHTPGKAIDGHLTGFKANRQRVCFVVFSRWGDIHFETIERRATGSAFEWILLLDREVGIAKFLEASVDCARFARRLVGDVFGQFCPVARSLSRSREAIFCYADRVASQKLFNRRDDGVRRSDVRGESCAVPARTWHPRSRTFHWKRWQIRDTRRGPSTLGRSVLRCAGG